jgi:hypothetical protein
MCRRKNEDARHLGFNREHADGALLKEVPVLRSESLFYLKVNQFLPIINAVKDRV